MPWRLLILLLGNRVQPATMLAYHTRPLRVACIGSTDRADTLKSVQEAIEYLLGPGRLAGAKLVTPYRLDATLAAIHEFVAEHSGLQPVIGLTGCPLPMSIAAYEAGRQLNCPVLYVNTGGAEIVDFTQPDQLEPLRVRFDIKDFLAICGLQAVAKRKPRCLSTSTERIVAARVLGAAGKAGTALIAALRMAGLLPARTRRLHPGALDEDGRLLLQELAAQHILTGLAEMSDGSVSYIIPAAGEHAFLNGDWLEEYVWEVAEGLRRQEPGLFDATGKGVVFRSGAAVREIDFIALRGGVPLIASCKSGAEPWQKQDLDEVAAIAQLLGGAYAIRLFITNQPPPASSHPNMADPYAQFQEQASRQRVVLVSGQEIGRLPEILRKEMLTPTYKPV